MDDIGYTDRLRFWWYSWRARVRVDKLIGPSVALLVPLATGVLWVAGDQNAVLHVVIALWVIVALWAVALLLSVVASMVARYRLGKLVEAEVARNGELHVRFT